LNDIEQLTSGVYGAIVVLEPGQHLDHRHDHLFVIGWDGPAKRGALPHLLVNGDSLPKTLVMEAGKPHRMRFINIGAAGLVRISLLRDTALVTWRRLAKDGADLPTQQAIRGASAFLIAAGETYDFEFTPEPGEYRLSAEIRETPLWTRRLVAR
jgi:hypothetical protein